MFAEAGKVDAAEADGDGARAVESLPVPAGDVAEGAVEDDGDPPKKGAPEDGAGAGAPPGMEMWHLLKGGVLTLHASGSCRALVMLRATP